MRKLLNSLMALFVISLMTLSMVRAVDPLVTNIDSLEINGDTVNLTPDPVTGLINSVSVEEGQPLNIRVGVRSAEEISNLEVDAKIAGYKYSDYEDLSDNKRIYNIRANDLRYANLKIENVPRDLGADRPALRLRILDSNSEAITLDIPLSVYSVEDGIDITDIVFSEGSTIKAGRSLLTIVQLENYGGNDEDNVKVTIEIPQLGTSATKFVDTGDKDGIDSNDRYNSEEMYVAVPADAATGDYDVKVTVKYDGRETVTKTAKVHVVADERYQAVKTSEDKLVLAIGPETQTVTPGQSATYAIALTNAGVSNKAYLLEAVTGNWASATLSESLVVLEPGKNKVVYVELTPATDAAVGEHTASVAIKSGSDVLQTVALKANVVVPQQQAANFNLRNGLEIALIILVVLLVIIGLIVGFSRLKKDDEGEQTYY